MVQESSSAGYRRWPITVVIREVDKNIEARAHLWRPRGNLIGMGLVAGQRAGKTRFNNADDLAAAVALSDLADQLATEASIIRSAKLPARATA